MVNVGKYSSPMDVMGAEVRCFSRFFGGPNIFLRRCLDI